jgi:nicotinamide-nucleotide amidase
MTQKQQALKGLVIQTDQLLRQQQLHLTTAESCTGGGLSYYLTSIPGSADWFERGFTTYSNAAKVELLGVLPATLDTFGAVSEQTAREMAEGALRHSKAQVSIAITGIAGPSGGSAEKPVGTVWIAWAKINSETIFQKNIYTGDRQDVRLQAMVTALEILTNQVLKN